MQFSRTADSSSAVPSAELAFDFSFVKPSLPTDLAMGPIQLIRQKPVAKTLTGRHPVQVLSVCDVSQPKFNETEVDDNSSEEDQEPGVENMFQRKAPVTKTRKKRSARMLMMVVSDGVTKVKAVENQQIECLNPEMSVGTKLVLQGPIEVHAGVLMLMPKNIQFLGGGQQLERKLNTATDTANQLASGKRLPQVITLN